MTSTQYRFNPDEVTMTLSEDGTTMTFIGDPVDGLTDGNRTIVEALYKTFLKCFDEITAAHPHVPYAYGPTSLVGALGCICRAGGRFLIEAADRGVEIVYGPPDEANDELLETLTRLMGELAGCVDEADIEKALNSLDA
jgi:hypothetical protein